MVDRKECSVELKEQDDEGLQYGSSTGEGRAAGGSQTDTETFNFAPGQRATSHKKLQQQGQHPLQPSMPSLIWRAGNVLVIYKPAEWTCSARDMLKRTGDTLDPDELVESKGFTSLADLQQHKFTAQEKRYLHWWTQLYHGLDRDRYPTLFDEDQNFGLCHRLDRETSGAVLFGITGPAYTQVRECFHQHYIRKLYVCLCHGHIEGEGRLIDEPMTVRSLGPEASRAVLDRRGQRARTNIRLMGHYTGPSGDKYSLCTCEIAEGRMHQIRLHFADVLHAPLVSDFVYQKRKVKEDRHWCPRVFLHAYAIGLPEVHGEAQCAAAFGNDPDKFSKMFSDKEQAFHCCICPLADNLRAALSVLTPSTGNVMVQDSLVTVGLLDLEHKSTRVVGADLWTSQIDDVLFAWSREVHPYEPRNATNPGAMVQRISVQAKSASAEMVADLVQRLDAVAENLPVPERCWLANIDFAKTYDDLMRGTMHTPQFGRRRGLHQLQVESIGSAVCLMVDSVLGSETPRVGVELGAGKALLGCCLAKITGISVTVMERQRCPYNYDGSRSLLPDPSQEIMGIRQELQDVGLNEAVRLLRPASDERPHAFVWAKHLCGAATCAALHLVGTALREGGDVQGCIIAPCCHAQLTWEAFCNPSALEVLGFCAQDFPLLLALLLLSKEKSLKQQPCGLTTERHNWEALKGLGEARTAQLGRVVRHVIEEARRRFLVDLGFNASLVQYVPESVTPDNLLLVATLAPLAREAVSSTHACQFSVMDEGVILHVGSLGTLVYRVLEYLLELRAADLRSFGRSAIEWVYPTHMLDKSCTIAVGGSPGALLPKLRNNDLIGRVCHRMFPFDSHADSLQQLCDSLVSMNMGASDQLRLDCCPSNLKQSIIPTLPSKWLSPSRFSHILSVVCWKEGDSGCQELPDKFLYCKIPRALWDLRAWRECHKNNMCSVSGSVVGDGNGASKTQRILEYHLNESLERLQDVMHVHGQRVLLIADTRAQLEAMAAWCMSHGAHAICMLLPRKTADLQWEFEMMQCTPSAHPFVPTGTLRQAGVGGQEEARGDGEAVWRGVGNGGWSERLQYLSAAFSAQLCGLATSTEVASEPRTILFRYDRGLEDAVQLLAYVRRAGGFPEHASLVGQVKLGHHGKAGGIHGYIAAACEKEAFAVRIRHLLTDHETERTLVLSTVTS
eukprot:TRINITY_DN102392_c0_g1_i1.p1 TRINITY_DN102392_c0_g1~~TRINITY_DN102392_c0_g1_i1.p1  ORF type:complete len:1184 (-),score=147.45 TRINITY_DN102392_c0_g1_i1:89-3640(-)